VTRPFLVTGCGRSGTAWAAAVFTALGYPCGHEAVFRYDGAGQFTQPDASWLAMPYARALHDALGTPVLRMVRDPYEVAASAYAKGFLYDPEEPFAAYAIRNCSIISAASDHLGRVLRWVASWDWALESVPHMDVMLNSPDVRGMVQYATGREPEPGEVSDVRTLVGLRTNANEDPWQVRPSRARIDDHYDGHLIRARAERFGYL
jgi:hypothetical protein